MAIITKDIGDIMAEKSNNVDELNRLAQEGRIAQKDDDKEHKKDVQDASKGKKTVEEVEQLIDETELLEELYRNKMFTNMIQPCLLEGENLLGKLKGYFELHKVRPSDLVKEIQTQVNERRLEINRNSQTLFFGEDGSINEILSIEKAVKNQRPVAKYIRNVYMEEGKQLPEIEDHTLHGKFMADLKEKPDSYFIQINEEYQKKSNEIKVDMYDYFRKRGAVLEENDTNEPSNTNEPKKKWGQPFFEEFSAEGNMLFGTLIEFDELVAEPIDKAKSSEATVKMNLAKMFAAQERINEILKKSDSELLGYGLNTEDIKMLRSFATRIQGVIKEKFQKVYYIDIDKSPEKIRKKLGEDAIKER